jgi:hypothetical protein
LDEQSADRILEVIVDGDEYLRGTASQARQLEAGNFYLNGAEGIYYLANNAAGDEALAIWPKPDTAGLTIVARAVIEPVELTGTDEPKVPPRFRRAIVDYAAAMAFATQEDNPELRSYYQQEFDVRVSRLKQLRLSREGGGVVQMAIEGWTG